MTDIRPESCRFRLQDEGKSYPRSSCTACGRRVTTGLGKRCYLETERLEADLNPSPAGVFLHDWVPSTLGHGEVMCSLCLMTNREAAVLGKLNHCEIRARDSASELPK